MTCCYVMPSLHGLALSKALQGNKLCLQKLNKKKGLNGNFMYQGTNLEILSCVSVMAEQKASSENL